MKPKAISYHIAALHPSVTGSSILVTALFPNGEKKIFLIDCGIFQEFQLNDYNNDIPFNVTNIDYVFLTHNHVDHSGRLPFLISKGYPNNIYCSQDTKDLLPAALFDCATILDNDSKRKTKKVSKFVPPLYTSTEVMDTLKVTRGMEYNKSYNMDENLSVTFLGNDHLLGAACILIQLRYEGCEDVNLLFTGDYNVSNLFQKVPEIPKWVKKLKLIIIQESTYGDSTSNNIEYTYDKKLVELLEDGKTVLSPVIACERAEQVLLRIKTLQDENKIDKDIPIFLCGTLASKYFKIFANKSVIDFVPDNINIVSSNAMRLNSPMFEGKNISVMQEIPDVDLDSIGPKIILTTSGMGDNGKAPFYMSKLAMREDVTIFFTCYLPETTLGNALMKLKHKEDSEYTFNIFGEKITIPINCDIIQTNEFSSHAKGDQLIDFLKQFPNLAGVFVNHGNPIKKDIYAQKIVNEINPEFVKNLDRSIFYSLSGYEILNVANSKFINLTDLKESKRKANKDAQVKKNKPKYNRARFKAFKRSIIFNNH